MHYHHTSLQLIFWFLPHKSRMSALNGYTWPWSKAMRPGLTYQIQQWWLFSLFLRLIPFVPQDLSKVSKYLSQNCWCLKDVSCQLDDISICPGASGIDAAVGIKVNVLLSNKSPKMQFAWETHGGLPVFLLILPELKYRTFATPLVDKPLYI